MLLALLLGAWATYRGEFQQADALLDYHLRQIALEVGSQNLNSPVGPSGTDGFDYSIKVWNSNGVTLYYSLPPPVVPNRAELGFATVQTSRGPWRVFAMQVRDEIIQVAQPMSLRNQLAASAAWRSLRPFLLLFPVMAALIWLLVGRGLAPIARLARAVGSRTAAAMDPVSEQVPVEVLPLVRALNDLLARLKGALEAQRQLVADAAHELRTPLAALQLQTDLVERAASSEERNAAIGELRLGLQRSARAVQQLLTLAREEPGVQHAPAIPVGLGALMRAVIDGYRPIALARHIVVSLSAPTEELMVLGEEAALNTLIANLLDNALHYTPAGGKVAVGIAAHGTGPVLTLEDSGPGIPAAERERVFDRFYRRDGSGGPGSGLGLAIVKAIADRHGVHIALGPSRLGGLAVRVEFPGAAAP